MSRLLKFTLLLIAIVAICSTTVSAWNGKGHMVVATIAYQQLSTAQRRTVTELLKKHPAYDVEWKEDHANLHEDIPLGAYLMMRASAWPDDARDEGGPWAAYHRAEWHYITYRIDFERGHDTTRSEASTLKPNVVWALDHCVRQMERADLPASTRAMYLAWLIHLVGDVHQPLHCASVFGVEYPEGDRGGNKWFVRGSRGGVQKLHTFWDGLLGKANAAAAYEQGVSLWELSQNLVEAESVFVLGESARYWSLESFRHAVEGVHLSGRFQGSASEANAPAMPAGYASDAKRLAQERCTLGGMRLAVCLAAVRHGVRGADRDDS